MMAICVQDRGLLEDRRVQKQLGTVPVPAQCSLPQGHEDNWDYWEDEETHGLDGFENHLSNFSSTNCQKFGNSLINRTKKVANGFLQGKTHRKRSTEAFEKRKQEIIRAKQVKKEEFARLKEEEYLKARSLQSEVQKAQKKRGKLTDVFREWEKNKNKWGRKIKRAACRHKAIDELLNDWGVSILRDDNQVIEGIRLANVDPSFPERECAILLKGFDTLKWTFESVHSVDPEFKGWKEYMAEANKKKNIVFTVLLARDYWRKQLNS